MSKKLTSVTVDLEFPITYDDREIKSLSFRRMKVKDTLAGEGIADEAKAGFALFAALAGVDVELILELDVEDLEQITDKIAPLLGKIGAEELAKLKAKTAEASSGEI